MDIPQIGEPLVVNIRRITLGADGKCYITVSHPQALNQPTLVWLGSVVVDKAPDAKEVMPYG